MSLQEKRTKTNLYEGNDTGIIPKCFILIKAILKNLEPRHTHLIIGEMLIFCGRGIIKTTQ